MEPDQTPSGKIVQIYTAILAQTGTDDPTAIILNNSLDDNAVITWTRDTVGLYLGTLTGKLIVGKTAIFHSGANTNTVIAMGTAVPPDSIYIDQKLLETPFDPIDGFAKLNVEVRIYK